MEQRMAVLIISGLLLASCPSAPEASTVAPRDKLAEIRARGTLVVATDADYMPQSRLLPDTYRKPDTKDAIDAGKPIRILDEPLLSTYAAVTLDRSSSRDPARLWSQITAVIQGMHQTGALQDLSLRYQGLDLTQEAARFDLAWLDQIP